MSRRDGDFDENCDPDHPFIIKYDDVVKAAAKIKPYIISTPCMAAHTQQDFGIYIHYKMEFLQPNGSFKDRGSIFALLNLPTDKKKLGVVVASTGNGAESFCYYAAKMNIPLVVILPYLVPISKIQRCTKLGAKVILQGNTFSEAQKYARALAKERGLTYINARDHPHVLLGYGSLGLEIMAQTPFADAIILPVATGGLAAAVSAVVKHEKPSCQIYGVEVENMAVFTKSLESNEPVTVPMQGNLAGNALTINTVGVNAFANAKEHMDKVLLVKDDWVARAMLHLIEREKFVVEGAGALPLAAILGNLVPELKSKNVVCILSGGNIDNLMLNRSLQRGLASEGRLVKFKVGVLHRTGAKSELMNLIADAGYNVITHFVDNTWAENETHYVEMKIVVETRGMEHALELKRIIERAYPKTASFENEPFNDKRTCPCYARKK